MKKIYSAPMVEIVKVNTASMMEELGPGSNPSHMAPARMMKVDFIE